MRDYAEPYLALVKLTSSWYKSCLKNDPQASYEISIDIADLAQQIEDLSLKMVNGNQA